jgi:hypothetical protein
MTNDEPRSFWSLGVSHYLVITSLLISHSAAQAALPSFRNTIQPILTKYGCNGGACHGAAAGKNGFKLSLRGFDDRGDWLALTRQASGRRVVTADPGRSLLLLKPTKLIKHKGGERFDTDSREFKLLAQWIAAGAPGPSDADPRIERIAIHPPNITLKKGGEHQFKVIAHFNDGTKQDVTEWAKYTSADEAVARVDELGGVSVVGNGGGAVTAWYLSCLAIARITVPYPTTPKPEVFAKAPRRNFIDNLVLKKLKELNLPPSGHCTDGEFIRRVYLDTLGILPTADETRAFLSDKKTNKRDRLIDSLFQRPEFIDYWSYLWSDLFLISSRNLKKPAMWAYYDWIRDQVASNTPWDEFARRTITASGSTLENGAANFFVMHDDPKKISETASLAFLGMSIQCAQCHNHPLEKWTNNDYYAMANLFARVRRKDAGGEGHEIVFNARTGDLPQPLTGRPQVPRPLTGEPLPPNSRTDRRAHFAQWLTSPDNPWFTRAIANRIWANFMSVGLVENVDDMRMTNPASNDALLDALAAHLVKNKFNLRALMRTILQSKTYQRSSVPLPGNMGDRRFYSRYYPQRLMAEVMLDAISQVTAVPTEFRLDLRNANQGLGPAYPAGWRALQLPDINVRSYFLKSFGRPARENTCTCERVNDPSVTQMLNLSNGDLVNGKFTKQGNILDQLLIKKLPTPKLIEELYLTALSRRPTKKEATAMAAALDEGKDKRLAAEDILFALVSSKEFLFNH